MAGFDLLAERFGGVNLKEDGRGEKRQTRVGDALSALHRGMRLGVG